MVTTPCVWRECKTTIAPVPTQKGTAKAYKNTESDAESSDDEPDVNVRRALLGEFRKKASLQFTDAPSSVR